MYDGQYAELLNSQFLLSYVGGFSFEDSNNMNRAERKFFLEQCAEVLKARKQGGSSGMQSDGPAGAQSRIQGGM